MGRTFLRQDTQVRNSDVYDDTIAPTEAAFETNPANVETDLNNLRSQVSNLLDDQAGDWFGDLNTPSGGSQRGVNDLNTDLNDLELKKMLCAVQVLTNVTVGGSDNFAVLSVSGSEAPSDVIAFGATTLGAVTALLAGGSGTHSLNEIAGSNPLSPKNIVWVRDAATKDAITSGGQEIFGLLQAESGSADGTAFDDTTQQGQISFVINSSDDLVACPAADIQGKDIEYTYGKRITLDNFPEDCTWPVIKFADRTSAAADVTRQNAYDNQGTLPVELSTNADIDLATGIEWAVRDAANADLLRVVEESSGGTTTLQVGSDVDTFNVDAIVNDFAAGLSVRSGSQKIDVGVTDGTINSDTAEDLRLFGTAELLLDDGNQPGSWAQATGIKLSDTSAEWTDFETNFGEVSLLNAINQAFTTTNFDKTCANVTSTETADTDIGGTAGGANLDAQIHDLSGGTFIADHDVFLNGQLMRNGADASANNDVYPGTSLALGQLKFEFAIKINDVLCAISRA